MRDEHDGLLSKMNAPHLESTNEPLPERKPQTLMAFDLGQKRTGVAFGSAMLASAQPLGVIEANGDKRLQEMAQYIKQWQPEGLVVGVPFHPDGKPHEQTRFAQNLAKQMRAQFKLPVIEVDERYSTTLAKSWVQESSLKGGQKAGVNVDALSACVILNQYFESHKS